MQSTSGFKKNSGTLSIISLLLLAGCSPNMKALNKQETISKAQVFGDTTLDSTTIVGAGADGGPNSSRIPVPRIDVVTGAGSDSGANSNNVETGSSWNSGSNTQNTASTGTDGGSTSNQANNENTASTGSDGGNTSGQANNENTASTGSDGGNTAGQANNENAASKGADGGSTSSQTSSQNTASTGSDGGDSSSTGADGGKPNAPSSNPTQTNRSFSFGTDGGTTPVVEEVVKPIVTKVAMEPLCSTSTVRNHSLNDYENLSIATSATITILNFQTNELCTASGDKREEMFRSAQIDISPCSLDLNQYTYVIDVLDSHGRSLLYGHSGRTVTGGSVDVSTGLLKDGIEILADVNHLYTAQYNLERFQVSQLANPQVQCARNLSPLVINFTAPGQYDPGLLLLSPNFGLWFDIMGANADPAPYAKKKISWPRNSNYMFLGLLNTKGKIEGIDQLFGDNTLGPDGEFATDGYAA
ncbi:MAG: hypothetical protein AB7H97_08210 [Pseudobdellovibrionaceae bacterium]